MTECDSMCQWLRPMARTQPHIVIVIAVVGLAASIALTVFYAATFWGHVKAPSPPARESVGVL